MVVNPRDFIHESDKQALEALKSIPGFDQLIKGFMKVYSEPSMKILNMSSKARLSPEQFPRIYNLLPPICEKFGIEVPEMYLEMNRMPNAYTSGDTYIFITVTTGLLELMTDEEIQVVLAHECGHILCHHVLYQTIGRVLLSGVASVLGLGGLVTAALSTAFSYWERCSEFSADRAAAVFCGGADNVVDVMLRLAGGSKEVASEINADLFVQQAAEYDGYVSDSMWNKVLESLALMDASHPFLAVRASGIRDWCQTEQFQGIIRSLSVCEHIDGQKTCPNCGAEIENEWLFCRNCGKPIKKREEGFEDGIKEQ